MTEEEFNLWWKRTADGEKNMLLVERVLGWKIIGIGAALKPGDRWPVYTPNLLLDPMPVIEKMGLTVTRNIGCLATPWLADLQWNDGNAWRGFGQTIADAVARCALYLVLVDGWNSAEESHA